MSKICSDTFASRTVTGGWGTASDGNTWAKAYGGGTLSVGSGVGKVTGNTGINTMLLGSTTATDVDIKVRFSVTATTNVASITFRSDSGAQNAYRARYTGTNFSFTKIVAGSTSSFGAGATVSVAINTLYWIHVQTAGSTLRANLWADGSSEPAGWQLNVGTDTTFTGPGLVGVHAQCHATTDNAQFDSFTANTTTDTQDIMLRARLAPATSTKDINLRARLASTATKDIQMRARIFAPTSTQDIMLRARLVGFASKDIQLRANIEETVIQLPAYVASSLSIQIGDYPAFQPKENTFSYSETSDGRSRCSFVLTDETGLLHFQWRLPVVVTHSVRGEIFRGYLNTPIEQNLPPSVTNTLQFVCIDEHWLADKASYEGDEFANQFAGDIAAFLAKELAPEGVVSGYAIDYDTTQDDFVEGTLVNVVAAENVGTTAIGNGDLELAPAGESLSIIETTLTDFQSGTLVGVSAGGDGPDGDGSLSLNDFFALRLSGTAAVSGGGNLYTYVKIWSGSQLIAAGDNLYYQVWISSTSPEFKAGVDFVCTDGATLRDNPNAGTDSQGIPPHPNQDISGLARDTWYVRGTGMSMAGKTISYVTLAFEGDTTGDYTAYFRFIYLRDSNNNIKATFFDGSTFGNGSQINVDPPQQMQNNGYKDVSVFVTDGFEKTGYRLSPAYDLSSVGIVRQSLISWTAKTPTDSTGNPITGYAVTVESSLDNGATWQTCTNNQSIPGLLPGLITNGKSLLLKETISNSTPDPTQSLALNEITASFAPSYAGSKQDIITTTATAADWQSGTLDSGIVYLNGALTINGYTRNWDDAIEDNQTLYGGNGPFQFIKDQQFGLQSGNAADVRSRLDFAGQWADFIAEVDIDLSFADVAENVGIVYRCTAWQNNNDTYAYSAFVNASQIILAKGTNSASGSGTYIELANVSLTLSSGNVHHLTVVASGSTHEVFLDDVLYITATDSTYTAAGYLGLRYYNNAGSLILHTAITGGVAIGSIVVNAVPVDIPNATHLTVDSGGAHPEQVYTYGPVSASSGNVTIQVTTNSAGNGAAQANWTPGFSHSSSVVVIAPLSRSVLFDNFGVAQIVIGNRTSPAVDLSSVSALQDSYIGWNATAPGNSKITVETSLDNGTTWQVATNGGPIPGWEDLATVQGKPLTGVTLQTLVSLYAPSVSQLPSISGLTTWVIGQLNASGYRISPPLSLGPVGRVGSSLIDWDVTIPNDATGYGIDVSPDGVNWTDVTSLGPGGGGAIPFIKSQDDPPFIADFSNDTSVNYTSSFLENLAAGAQSAFWTSDARNSRLIGTSGSSAVLILNSVTLTDGEIIIDTDQCEQGGVMWAISADRASCYELWIMDGSAARSPDRMKLFKIVNGQKTQLGLGAVLDFTRGRPQRFKVVQVGGTITVTVSFPVTLADGSLVGDITQTQSYTDPTPLQGGSVGLRSSGGTQHYSQFRVMNYGDDVSQGVLYTRTRLFSTDPLNTPQVQSLTVAVRNNTIGNGSLVPATTYSTLSGSTNTIAQDFDDLARLSGNYWWRIQKAVLSFQAQTGVPAPWIAIGKDMLVGGSIQVSYANDLYRNQAIIIGGTDTRTIPEIRIADGFRTSFDTGYPIEIVNSILVNDQPVSFGLQGLDTGKNWYYQQGQSGITADSSASPLPNGTRVKLNYEGIVNVIAKARNEGHIQLLKSLDRTSGVVSVTEKADGLNQAAAEALALARIDQYAKLAVTITFTTNRPGLHMGQLLTVYFPQNALNNQTFLITQVDYQPLTAVINGQVSMLEFFKVQATSGPIVGSWIHLFT
jgi:hypothetical protein